MARPKGSKNVKEVVVNDEIIANPEDITLEEVINAVPVVEPVVEEEILGYHPITSTPLVRGKDGNPQYK